MCRLLLVCYNSPKSQHPRNGVTIPRVPPLHALKLAKPYASRSRWGPQILQRRMQKKHSIMYVSTRTHNLQIPPPHLAPSLSFESPVTLGPGLGPRPADYQVSSRGDPERGKKYRTHCHDTRPTSAFQIKRLVWVS